MINPVLTTNIDSHSAWQWLYAALYLLAVFGVMLLTPLPWWGGAIIALITVAVSIVMLNKRQVSRPLHITSPRPDIISSSWQILYPNRRNNRKSTADGAQDELWEADLLYAHDYGPCIYLIFNVVHPLPLKKTMILWQDQMSIESWRQLKVMARW